MRPEQTGRSAIAGGDTFLCGPASGVPSGTRPDWRRLGANIQKTAMREFAGFEQHHQIGAAREGAPDAGLTRESVQSFGQCGRRAHFVGGNEGPHCLPIIKRRS